MMKNQCISKCLEVEKMSKCEPLKITATLLDGRLNSANGIIMLDSILYHAWFIKYAPQVLGGEYDEKYIHETQKYIGLPLKQLPGNRWAASKGIYEEIEQKIENFNKRPDFFAPDKIDYLIDNKGIINESSGKYRAFRVPQLIRTVKDKKITFYAVGNKQKIQELLQLMISVGKKYSMGYGIITKWEVEPCEGDYTTEHPIYGLMRPLEVSETDKKYNNPIMEFGVKPPYWKPQNMRLCYVPIK